MGILTAIVLNPVLAHRVDATAESIPPETPTTKVEILFFSAYSNIQLEISTTTLFQFCKNIHLLMTRNSILL